MFVVKIVEGMKNSIARRNLAAQKSIEDESVNNGFGQPMPTSLLSAIEVIVDKSRDSEINKYSDVGESFEEELTQVFEELFDPNVAFTQVEDVDACTYCDYKKICRR